MNPAATKESGNVRGKATLVSVLLDFRGTLGEVEFFCSPAPLDPRKYRGWRVIEVCTGWIAIRGR